MRIIIIFSYFYCHLELRGCWHRVTKSDGRGEVFKAVLSEPRSLNKLKIVLMDQQFLQFEDGGCRQENSFLNGLKGVIVNYRSQHHLPKVLRRSQCVLIVFRTLCAQR